MPTATVRDGDGGTSRLIFQGASSGSWIDPPATDGFIYSMDAGSLFTAIEGFPNGFGNAFTVGVGGVTLPVTFAAGDVLNFADWSLLLGPLLINGQGVKSFRLTGITPTVDASDALAFPLRLAFDTPTADFTMTAVPEPASIVMGLMGAAALGAVVIRNRRARG